MSGFVFFLDASPSPAYNPRHPRVVSVLVEYEGIETNNLIEKDAVVEYEDIETKMVEASTGQTRRSRLEFVTKNVGNYQLPITNQ